MNQRGTIRIYTDRLVLKKITLADAENLYKLLTDKEVIKYLTGIPIYTGVNMAVDYIRHKLTEKYKRKDFYDWGIYEKGSRELIGRISTLEMNITKRRTGLAWYLRGDKRGKGYMTEAVKAVVKCLQDAGFERIDAYTHLDNEASERVAERCGFQYEGTLRKWDYERDGSLYDAKMYSIIKE